MYYDMTTIWEKIMVQVPAVASAPSLWTPAVIQNSEHFSHKLSVRVMTVASLLAVHALHQKLYFVT